MKQLCKLKQWKSAMRPRRYKEVLAAGGGQKALQPIFIILHAIFLHQVQRSRILTHLDEKVRRGHKNRELELWLIRATGYIHRIKARPIHANMHCSTVLSTSVTLQTAEIADPALMLA